MRDADGEWGLVERVRVVVNSQMMYDLTVAEAHTFFVGDGEWLVHNDDCAKSIVEAVYEHATYINSKYRTSSARPSTVTVFDTSIGRITGESGNVDINSFPPEIQMMLRYYAPNPKHRYTCGEMDCLYKFLQRGGNIEDLVSASIISLKIRRNPLIAKFTYQPPCNTGCKLILQQLGITVIQP